MQPLGVPVGRKQKYGDQPMFYIFRQVQAASERAFAGTRVLLMSKFISSALVLQQSSVPWADFALI
jgi:hypothetical protein